MLVLDDGRARVGVGRGVVNHKLLAPNGRFHKSFGKCRSNAFKDSKLSRILNVEGFVEDLRRLMIHDWERKEYKQLVTDVGFKVHR